jgi:hypothetical protein
MSAMYRAGRNALAGGLVRWTENDAEALLLDMAVYTPDLETDEYSADLPAGAVMARAQLAGKKLEDGTATADPVVFPKLEGAKCGACAIAVDGRLLVYYDDEAAFPIRPIGTDVVLDWNRQGLFRVR